MEGIDPKLVTAQAAKVTDAVPTLAEAIYDNAVAKGFYEDYNRVMSRLSEAEDLEFVRKIWLSHRLMLIVSELAEGLEGIRDSNYSGEPKSGGLLEELADAGVRLLDLFTHLGADGESIMAAKHRYNTTRPIKHGRSL